MDVSAAVREVIDRLAERGSVTSRRDGVTRDVFPVGVSLAEGAALKAWVLRERARRTIETGLAYAISTLHICAGLVELGYETNPHHVAIDPAQHWFFADSGLQVLEDAGVRGMVDHVDGLSEIVLPELVQRGERFDLAFVDGNHRFDGVFVDLFYLGRLVRPGGVIFVDDFQLPGIRKAAEFYTRNLGWIVLETSAADALHQWTVLRTSAEPDERHFAFFVDF